jgi:hypothetical protein
VNFVRRLLLGAFLSLSLIPILGSPVASADPAPAVGGGGGGTTTTTTSTTEHETHTAVSGPASESSRTRVTAALDGTIIHDETVTGAPTSPAVAAALERARAALTARGIAPSAINGPATVSSSRDVLSTQVTSVLDHTETSVTSTTTFGPATILIGPNQSQTFFAAGSTNVNVNTHTEYFYNDIVTQTVVNNAHLQLSATTPPAMPPVIPQVFQNPGAIAAIMSSVAAGNKNPR